MSVYISLANGLSRRRRRRQPASIFAVEAATAKPDSCVGMFDDLLLEEPNAMIVYYAKQWPMREREKERNSDFDFDENQSPF